jgi:hypothetical protein
VNKVEATVASWYKNLPHLPENGRKWLADNIWWLVLISVILGVMALFPMIGALVLSGAVVSSYGAYGYTGYNTGMAFTVIIISIIFYLVDVVLSAVAISPLKGHRKRGWSILFLLLMLSLVFNVATAVASYNIGSLVFGLVGVAIGGYLLFEIRDLFSTAGAPVKQQPVAAAPTETKK